ncbi:SDR family oxidoreductase [Microbacterium sp. KRD172]|uniref:SDR family NAD(P)-dependent oxidoreductase n=1 Tax=Microbacterium sp. KRD172 TaxID=2729727 RepID=UPI0027DD1500|nr:SDR family oxidoreductase [Microbacterium sp. KRD172]
MNSQPSVPAGTVIAITGGASGIGLAVAVLAAAAGARPVVLDLQPSQLPASAAAAGVRAVATDVTDADSVAASFADIEHTEGRLDALVNCAGFARPARVTEGSDDEWSRLVDVHLGGTMRTCRAAHGLLATSANDGGSPAIVNVSSVAALAGVPGRAAYSSAKAGISALSRTLAVEWAPERIRVNSVAPGITRTTLMDRLIAHGDVSTEGVERRTPLRRLAIPDEIAAPILFLCSSGASFITGTTLVVDGGLSVDGDWYER